MKIEEKYMKNHEIFDFRSTLTSISGPPIAMFSTDLR